MAPAAFVSRLNAGEIVPAPPKTTPAGIQTEQILVDQTTPHPKPEWLVNLVKKYAWLPLVTLGLAVMLVVLLLLFMPAAVWLMLGLAVAAGLVYLYRKMNEILKQLAQPEVFTEQAQTPEQVDKAPLSPDFRITEPDETFRPGLGSIDSTEARRFKLALKEMFAVDIAARSAAFQPPRQQLDLPLSPPVL
jgi:hypothetical protein